CVRSSSADHRDLRAFPTRRSSDLDYGAPTSRERLFLVARRDGQPIVWPEPTHAAKPTKGQQPYRTAAECIDWSMPSQSIFGRKKDRKSTRLNSSHVKISYAVFCLK